MKRLLLGVVPTLLLVPAAAAAQVNLGAHIGWGDEADFAFGARLTANSPWVDPAIEFSGSFDYFFPEKPPSTEDVEYWEVNLNAVYRIPIDHPSLSPYAGAGVNIARSTIDSASQTDVGANLLAGVKYVAGPVVPFGELRVELGGGDQFVLAGGLLFNLWAGN
ncbi:MAG: porin family protein [Gemmatimonadetes bacterium]|uniref:Porin family protein n=1 Tax=Candidatus Kutchimonas denitrificans TaxID=3056748 RepID=A0AAE4ZBR7_9BACT|nr:porin family protein [Gemmatimonadota bacterium]NIR76086.1 porin family protein [Candidatus Kutchimonas denitrificans]NIS00465.1 porin family protein [Gemmatimonadota bacterium]NIT66123.1 porin family protein [Gemmatimonadota bacterium]NIU54201.1 outer membrane beta-barrel protein [Gemmatimonadota bacterium]